jgi:hypothetical protein
MIKSPQRYPCHSAGHMLAATLFVDAFCPLPPASVVLIGACIPPSYSNYYFTRGLSLALIIASGDLVGTHL